MEQKLTPDEFVLRAIKKLRKPPYRGIHTVYSGFNQAFREYFEGSDPIAQTNMMAKEGKIIIRPVKGGVMLYLPEEVEKIADTKDVIKDILS
ncbi:MAG: hypothetical protein NTZ78_08395 [Candidatus Aureabacteria bacterium]|nr:hypothetical protein [Candidatus Auribacterota bacterium]